jgi:hypothetical protein
MMIVVYPLCMMIVVYPLCTVKSLTTTLEKEVCCRTQEAELQPSTDYDLTPEFNVPLS